MLLCKSIPDYFCSTVPEVADLSISEARIRIHQAFQLSLWLSVHMKVKVTQLCLTFVTPWVDYTFHGILQVRILEWVAFPFPRGNLPNPGIEPRSPALQADSLPAKPLGKRQSCLNINMVRWFWGAFKTIFLFFNSQLKTKYPKQ